MRSNRPPCRGSRKAVMLLLLVSISIAGHADGINLPDLVLSRAKKQDIPQSDDYADISATWSPSYPGSRRLYPLELQTSESPGGEFRDPRDFGNPDALMIAASDSDLQYQTDSGLEKRPWNTSVKEDVREGLDIGGDIGLGALGTAGIEAFVPLGIDTVRPTYAGLTWERQGLLSGTAWAGGKDESGAIPAGQVHLDLDRGFETMDFHSVDITGIAGKYGGGSLLWGSRLDIPLGESLWFLNGELGAGAWIDHEEGSWLADGSVGLGIQVPEYRFRALLGLGGGLYGSEPYLLAPVLDLSIKVGDIWMLSFDAGLERGYESQADEVLKKHTVGEFSASLPMSAVYGAGVSVETENGSFLELYGKGGYGKYSFSADGSLVLRSDVRYSAGLRLIIPVKEEHLKTKVSWSKYTRSEIHVWSAALAQTAGPLEFRVQCGSEDEFLGAGMPGIRGEQPIIGIGMDWMVSSHWYVGSLFYARMPLEDPSMVITIARREK